MMDAYQRDFGQHLRRLRRQIGVTQEEVAHRADVHVTYLSGIERGIRNPALKNIHAIAQALGVSTASLFTFEASLPDPDPAKETPYVHPTPAEFRHHRPGRRRDDRGGSPTNVGIKKRVESASAWG